MSNNPDEIRSNIEETRRDLGENVDALADKVNPSKIAERQANKVKGALHSTREHLMGSVADAHDAASGAVSDAAGKAQTTVKGNPLAVGLIAVGVGWLVASLIPATDAEKKLATSAKDAAQPLIDDLAATAKSVASDLKEPAQDAFDAVKNTATDAVESVKAEAADAVDDVKDQAQASADAVQQSASTGEGDSWNSPGDGDTWSSPAGPLR
jgi:ElaB/YqjD/DUF883 family membrane-anchored ribosome-binding protein